MPTKRNPVRVVKPCGKCGEPVSRAAYAAKGPVFCNRNCYLTSDYHRQNASRHTKARYVGSKVKVSCTQCGRDLERNKYKADNTTQPFCSRACWADHRLRNAPEQITNQGYVKVYVGRDYPGATKTGHILQHRKVMQDVLGRPLTDDENIHHRNGIRTDNRPENLELWSRSQPCGQRVADKIRWAEEILALYANLPEEMKHG